MFCLLIFCFKSYFYKDLIMNCTWHDAKARILDTSTKKSFIIVLYAW